MNTELCTGVGENQPPSTTTRDASRRGSAIHLQVDYPRPGVATITIAGAIDDASLPRLAELVQQRLTGMIDVLVMDLSAVTFISISGLELLKMTFMQAGPRGITLRLVATTHAVLRAVRSAGLHEMLQCYGNLPDALAPLSGAQT